MPTTAKSIDARSLADAAPERGQIQLLDVRTPAEFEEAHIQGAKLAPLDSLDPEKVQSAFDTEKPLYVICRSGGRASSAIEKLRASGCENLVLLEGGMNAWQEQNLVVKRGKRTMSLERQVRIAAGLLIVTGCALGYFIHPGWSGLAAFVGAGLTFAGLTDTCAMGMLIAKLPWNQKGSTSQACLIRAKA